MLDQLPLEILNIVASNLSQSDCYHLTLASKTTYNGCVSRLYDSIIIDSSNQIFHEELVNFTDVVEYQDKKYKSTVIKTCNGLKHFFKTVDKNQSLLRMVNHIRVIKLPDHFIEFELAKDFKNLFGKLPNLKGCDFQYNSCFININDLISRLPHQDRLVELTGDFTTTMSLKKRKLNGLTTLSSISPSLELQKLSLINWQYSEFLKDLRLPMTLTKLSIVKNQQTVFPINYSLVNTIGIDFNYLQDCFNKYFYNGMTNELQTDVNSIFTRNTNTSPVRYSTDTDFNVVKNIFHKNRFRLNLNELVFDGVTFNENDHLILDKHCDLSQLKKLTILECDDTYNCNWLSNIAPYLHNLSELNISYESFDHVPLLISSVQNLEKLYINLQGGWDYLTLFKSLNKHKSLTRLIVDSTFENQAKSIPIKILESKLVKFKKLVKLRITVSIKSLSRLIYNVLPYLPNLQFLELIFEEFNVVNFSGNSAYMIEEQIYDDENEEYEFDMNQLSPQMLTLKKIKSINSQLLQVCPSLKYSTLFNVILTKDNFIKERGLESWFVKNLL